MKQQKEWYFINSFFQGHPIWLLIINFLTPNAFDVYFHIFCSRGPQPQDTGQVPVRGLQGTGLHKQQVSVQRFICAKVCQTIPSLSLMPRYCCCLSMEPERLGSTATEYQTERNVKSPEWVVVPVIIAHMQWSRKMGNTQKSCIFSLGCTIDSEKECDFFLQIMIQTLFKDCT